MGSVNEYQIAVYVYVATTAMAMAMNCEIEDRKQRGYYRIMVHGVRRGNGSVRMRVRMYNNVRSSVEFGYGV